MSRDPTAGLEGELTRAAAEMIETRRDLHRHPELAHQESRTAGVVAARCRELGYAVREGVGGTGVVTVSTALPLDAAKFPSPAYAALMVCLPTVSDETVSEA